MRIEKRPEWTRLPAREVPVELGYELWAPSYDPAKASLFDLEESAVQRYLARITPSRVLDAATGTGRHLNHLAALGADVVGLDTSPHMIERAIPKLNGTDVSFVLGRLEALPFGTGRFDLVLCALALCHIEDLSAPLSEFRRVLEPGGQLVLSDFHPDAVAWGLRSEFTLDGEQVRLPNPQHDIGVYLGAVRAAGFELKSVEGITQGEVGLPPSRDLAPEFHQEWSELNFWLVASAIAV